MDKPASAGSEDLGEKRLVGAFFVAHSRGTVTIERRFDGSGLVVQTVAGWRKVNVEIILRLFPEQGVSKTPLAL